MTSLRGTMLRTKAGQGPDLSLGERPLAAPCHQQLLAGSAVKRSGLIQFAFFFFFK